MSNFPIKKQVIIFFIANLAACVSPQKTAPDPGSPVAEFPIMSVGDTWVVLRHYSANHRVAKFTYTVTSVDEDGSFEIRQENDKDKRQISSYFYSSAIGITMINSTRYDPQALQFPLFIGKAWTTESNASSVDGDNVTYRSKYVVRDFTAIKTKLGIFETFRIRADVSAVDGSWSGRSEYWYAPAAKSIVKSKHSHIRGVKLLEMSLTE